MRRALADARARPGPPRRRRSTTTRCGSIARLANGDARSALNVLELAVQLAPAAGGRRRVTEAGIREAAQRRTLLYDKSGEEHYNLISALHKSLRDSRSRRRALLDDAHARLRRGPALRRAPPGALRLRGRRQRRPARALAHAGRQGRLRLPGLAGGRAGARAGHALSWRWRRSPTPPTSALQRGEGRRAASGRPSPCRCTSATRPPAS